MINVKQQNGRPQYDIKEFVLDTAADVADLPTDCAVGSTAFVIATSAIYMINSSGEWKEI